MMLHCAQTCAFRLEVEKCEGLDASWFYFAREDTMKITLRILFLFWLFGLPLGALADQVILKNGDRITGKIQKKDGANLVIKSDIFGLVTIPWEAVTQVTSDELLTVVLPEGKTLQGQIATEENKMTVKSPTVAESIALPQVTAIRNAEEQKAWERLQNPGLLSLWYGYADLGVSFARGNAVTSNIATALKTTRETRNDKISAYFNQIYSNGRLADGTEATTAKAVRGGWMYDRNLKKGAFLNLFNDYEYDAFQSLDLRFVLGGGFGYSFLKNDLTRLDLLGGLDYSREKFSTPLTRDSVEGYLGNRFSHQFSKTTALTQSFRMFTNLKDAVQYRMNFDIGTSTVLRKWLSWQLTLSDRFLNDPIPGHKKNDVLLTTGLRFSFKRD
jgi:putative salt-induced outer membrane protein YdiY